jgi:hypothetical protein
MKTIYVLYFILVIALCVLSGSWKTTALLIGATVFGCVIAYMKNN